MRGDAAPHTKPCWADKWLKLPEGGFCHVPWKGGTVVSVMILWFASFLLVGHDWFAVCGSLAWFQLAGSSPREGWRFTV